MNKFGGIPIILGKNSDFFHTNPYTLKGSSDVFSQKIELHTEKPILPSALLVHSKPIQLPKCFTGAMRPKSKKEEANNENVCKWVGRVLAPNLDFSVAHHELIAKSPWKSVKVK